MDSVNADTQWTQYTVDAVDTVCTRYSRIVIYGGGDIVFDTNSSKWIQWEQYAEDTVRSGRSMQWMQ